MKILMYNVRQDEEQDIKNYQAKHDVEISTNNVPLSDKTVALAAGYDGIITQQHGSLGSEKVYEKLHSFGIKQIGLRITGYEIVDLDAARKNDLVVTNVPAYSPRSVSELVLAHTMWLVRHMGIVTARESHGNFSWNGIESGEIHDMTIGIIGAGKIGSAVARIFRALGATVIAADPVKRPELNDTLTYVDHETVFKTSDIITMHTPLTSETHHMIDETVFRQMKSSAFFINASRGPVVKTEDLVSALENREIAGAAIDTYEGESATVGKNLDSKVLDKNLQKLLAMPNVNVSPHVGFYTDVAVKNMIEIALNDTIDILNDAGSLHVVS